MASAFTSNSRSVVNPLPSSLWVALLMSHGSASIAGFQPLTVAGSSGISSGLPRASVMLNVAMPRCSLSHSAFPLSMLQRCMVDSWVEWTDFKHFASRPFGYREVWIGYDPAHTGDSAGLVVIAPPLVAGGKFRVLEKHQFKGLDFAGQADKIKKLTQAYNVTHIGIDTTGIGQGVFQLVRQFFPMAKAFNYSVDVKTRLVLKALDVISRGRFEFDAGWTDLAAAFMAIRKTVTPSGRQATFEASRSEEVSHADLAWACMHALANEPLEGMTTANTGFMEIC